MCGVESSKPLLNDILSTSIISHISASERHLSVQYSKVSSHECQALASRYHTLILSLDTFHSYYVARIDGQEYIGSSYPGNFSLKPSGSNAFFQGKTQGGHALVYTINPYFLKRLSYETETLNPDHIELLEVLLGKDLQLMTLSHLFYRELTNTNIGEQIYTDSLSILFGVHLLRYYCAVTPSFKHYRGGLDYQRLQTVLEYINAHLDEKISLNNIAQQINIAPYYFSMLFKQSMGIPPYEYVLRQRVEKAKDLIQSHKDLSLKDIALQCGFADQTQLHRHFRKFTGMTPKKYRDRSSL